MAAFNIWLAKFLKFLQLVLVIQHGLVPPQHLSQSSPHSGGMVRPRPIYILYRPHKRETGEEVEKQQVPNLSPHRGCAERGQEAGEMSSSGQYPEHPNLYYAPL